MEDISKSSTGDNNEIPQEQISSEEKRIVNIEISFSKDGAAEVHISSESDYNRFEIVGVMEWLISESLKSF